jgi:hypothetical protein
VIIVLYSLRSLLSTVMFLPVPLNDGNLVIMWEILQYVNNLHEQHSVVALTSKESYPWSYFLYSFAVKTVRFPLAYGATVTAT